MSEIRNIYPSTFYFFLIQIYFSLLPHTAGWATSTLATAATNISLKWGPTSTGMTGEPTTPRFSPSAGWETCRRTAGAASRWPHRGECSRLWADRREYQGVRLAPLLAIPWKFFNSHLVTQAHGFWILLMFLSVGFGSVWHYKVRIVTDFQSSCNACKNGSNSLCLQTS